MALTVLDAVKVSAPEKGFWTRKMVSPTSTTPMLAGSEKTIQPPCQLVELVHVAPSPDWHTVTVRPSLMASERANCKSPKSPFNSLAMRLAFVMYLKEGMA